MHTRTVPKVDLVVAWPLEFLSLGVEGMSTSIESSFESFVSFVWSFFGSGKKLGFGTLKGYKQSE